jgi:flagellar biosynthesis GTPase FlhF
VATVEAAPEPEAVAVMAMTGVAVAAVLEVAEAEVPEAAVVEVVEVHCRKRRKTPEERAAEAASKEAAAQAKAEAKATAKAAREEEARRKASERSAAREEVARRRATERETAAAAREASTHVSRASVARQIQEAATVAAQQAVQRVMAAVGARGSQRGSQRGASQRTCSGSQRGGASQPGGASQRGGASQPGGSSQRGGSRHGEHHLSSPPPPPPSSRGRVLKRPRKYGDAGELDDGPASRFRSAMPTPKPAVDVATEMGVPAFALPGEAVYAMGLRAGMRMRFRAEVTALRVHFPRIVVRYTASEDGMATHPLALPEMRVAYVTMPDVAPRDW